MVPRTVRFYHIRPTVALVLLATGMELPSRSYTSFLPAPGLLVHGLNIFSKPGHTLSGPKIKKYLILERLSPSQVAR
jgi:hypothetical protein